MFSKNIRTLYLYVVSFITLLVLVSGVVSLVEKITNYFYPVEYYYYYDYNGNFINDDNIRPIAGEDNSLTVKQNNIQRQSLRDIFTSFAIVLVSFPLYKFHWAMIQKEKEKNNYGN